MTFAEFQAQFEAAGQFVRLHGWVNQSEERLAALREGVRSGLDRQELVTFLLSRLHSASATQERLLSLFLLKEAGWSSEQIAGLLYQTARGQVDSTDGAFFSRQVFPLGPPIPAEVSKLITDRVYLTHQRAILQAMKIEEFDSDYSPQDIILHMTHLLCRIDLNEQNRTMLYLLLSRIDAELPEELDQAVVAAMESLREIILDVERRRDKVLSDEHPLPPPVSADPWAPRGTSAAFSAAPGAPAPAPPKGETPRLAPSAAAQVRESGTPVRAAYDPPSKTEVPWPSRTPFTPQTNPRPSISAAPLLKEGPGLVTTLAERTERRPQAAPSGKAETLGPAPFVEAAPRQSEARTPSAPENRTRFRIRFDRQRGELKNLLDALQRRPPPEEAEVPASDQEPESAPPVRRRRIFWPWWAAAAAAILALAIWLILGTKAQDVRQFPAPVPTPQVSAPIPAQPAPGPAPAAPQLDIRHETDGRFWYPRPGESLWRLYTFLGETEGYQAGWDGFQAEILSANPSIRAADLVYPRERIRFGH